MSGQENDIVAFCMPDFGKCGPGVNEIMPACQTAIQFLTEDLLKNAATMTGSKAWKM